jgi:hypothetical protein
MRSSQVVNEIYTTGEWDLADWWIRSSRVVNEILPSREWDRAEWSITKWWMRSSRMVYEIQQSGEWDLAEWWMRSSWVVWASYIQRKSLGFYPDRHPPTQGALRGGRDESVMNIEHCKKKLAIFPSPAGMSLDKLSWPGIISDIPAGYGKIGNCRGQ